ncbi:MAG TPA: hypothetical protein VFB78_09540 [Acidimicrobiales bacterium]|nr:hypothetical protein [Acidimicrobiales bacterium]
MALRPLSRGVSLRVATATLIAIAAATGWAAYRSESTSQSLPLIGSLRLPILLAGALFLAFLPLGMKHWWLGLAVFLAWLPFEDLFRKFNGNALEIYAVKDVLFVFALVCAMPQLFATHAWRRALGSARIPTLLLVGWAIALSVPTILDADWRQAAIALHLDFLYLPLVGVGFLVGVDRDRASRAVKGLALFAAVVLAIGLVQALVGPTFLNPGQAAPGLGGFSQYRGSYLVGGRGIFIPTGTFVDPGRFAQLAELAVALVLAWLVSRGQSRSRALAAIAAATILAAVWASGSRAVLVLSAVLVAVALLAAAKPQDRVRRLTATAALALTSMLVISVLLPTTFSATRSWYTKTLDPRSASNEWAFRWHSYGGGMATGVRIGGVLGRGTGDQSLGKQYLYGGDTRSLEGLYQLESGYGAIAAEWGLIGLALWLTWLFAWFRRLRRSCAHLAGTTHQRVAIMLSSWIAIVLAIQFFAGLQFFQNYFVNAYIWLLSGVVFGLAADPTARDVPLLEQVPASLREVSA